MNIKSQFENRIVMFLLLSTFQVELISVLKQRLDEMTKRWERSEAELEQQVRSSSSTILISILPPLSIIIHLNPHFDSSPLIRCNYRYT